MTSRPNAMRMLTGSLLLALLGGIGGIVLAYLSLDLLQLLGLNRSRLCTIGLSLNQSGVQITNMYSLCWNHLKPCMQ